MPDPTWFIDEHGARRFKTRRAAARHPEWREESRVQAQTSSAAAESEPAEQADADKTARKGTTKRS